MRQACDEPRSRAGAPLLRAFDWFESYRRGPDRVAVYARSTSGAGRGAPLYLQMVHVRSGVQQLTVEVSEDPAEAAVDPRGLLSPTVNSGRVG